MSDHHVSVTVQAPIHQVYVLFSHFHDFPKYMSFVEEVTYYDEQRSHWVAGSQEWDAVNEGWIVDEQIGWRSTRGLRNRGMVKFTPLTAKQTAVDVYLSYTPPTGMLGAVAEHLGFDNHLHEVLQQELKRFAAMVEATPQGALDPMLSHYLFHRQSAVTKGATTARQRAAMSQDPMMSKEALQERETRIRHAKEQTAQVKRAREALLQRQQQLMQQIAQEQQEALRQQAERDRLAARERAQTLKIGPERVLHPIYDTIGGRNAAMERTAIGDQDARSERFPRHSEDPMISRAPGMHARKTGPAFESPWRATTHGQISESEQEALLAQQLEHDRQTQQQTTQE